MASYDGIILDTGDTLSVGDTIPIGTAVPASTPTAAINLTAEIFGIQTTGEGMTGGLSISITGASVSPCYTSLGLPVADFKPMGNAGIFYFSHEATDFLAQASILESYIFGALSPSASITIDRVGGTEPYDAGSIRLILRQFTGLDYTLGGAPGPQPPGSAVDVSQPDPHFGAISPTSFTTVANQEFVIITGFGPEEWIDDGFGGFTTIDSGPASIAIDDVIWDYGHNKAFSSVDTTSPLSTYTIPFAFADPGGGFNVYTNVSENIRISSLVTGDNPPECGPSVGPWAINAQAGDGIKTAPGLGGTFDPATMIGILFPPEDVGGIGA